MFNRTKKVGKYILVSIPSKIIGLESIKNNNRIVKRQYQLLNAPICPYCTTAKMELDTNKEGRHRTFKILDENEKEIEFGVDLYYWNCLNPKCRAYELLPLDKIDAKKWAQTMQNSFASERINNLSNSEYNTNIKSHIFYSRLFYTAALCCFIYLIYCILFTDAPLLRILIPYTAIIIAFFVNGMRRSYRYWQLKNKIIFQDGSFKKWLYKGRWIV